MIIRDAIARDAPRIAEIWNHYIRNTVTTFTNAEKTPAGLAQDILSRQADGKAFLVAEQAGDTIGFATYFPFRTGPGYAHTAEHSVMLDPAAQGQGTGRALMTALETHARRAGIHSLIAGVAGENAAGVRFHSALGYNTIANLPEVGRKFDRWMDLILMQKIL